MYQIKEAIEARRTKLRFPTSTGEGMLAAEFGIDTRKKEFWAASLRVVEGDIAMFEQAALGS